MRKRQRKKNVKTFWNDMTTTTAGTGIPAIDIEGPFQKVSIIRGTLAGPDKYHRKGGFIKLGAIDGNRNTGH